MLFYVYLRTELPFGWQGVVRALEKAETRIHETAVFGDRDGAARAVSDWIFGYISREQEKNKPIPLGEEFAA